MTNSLSNDEFHHLIQNLFSLPFEDIKIFHEEIVKFKRVNQLINPINEQIALGVLGSIKCLQKCSHIIFWLWDLLASFCRSGDVIVMTTRTELTDDSISPYWWIPSSIAACLMTLYTLTHAAMALDGFLYACRQYRIELTKYMRATGALVESIQGRISCAAVFDFMDYIHPDVSYDRRRIDRINTPAALITGLIASWLCVALWAAIAFITIRQARRSRRVRV